VRRTVKYGVAAVVAALVLSVGAIAWAGADKAITVSVDGQARHLHTTASNVGGALADAGYKVAPHDIVAPSVTAKVHNGSTIVLERGRLLHLTVDGVARNVWVTAPTVAQALDDLGYANAELDAVSRSTRLPLGTTDLQLQSAKRVTISHDGQTSTVVTTDETVAQLLSDLSISLGPNDEVVPTLFTSLTDGVQIVVHRVSIATVSKSVPIAFATAQQADSSMTKGTSVVLASGAAGTSTVTYLVTEVDGVITSQTVVSTVVLTSPKTRVVRVGTKAVAVSASPPASTSGLNWTAVAACESNNHWNDNTGNGYYGGLQFSLSTWLSNGGGAYAARPDLATEAQQIAVANHLYALRGSAPWPVCGKYL
jgi:uncharacterized protein YabE (DUF348 family)